MRTLDDISLGDLIAAEEAGIDLNDQHATATYLDISLKDAAGIEALQCQFRRINRTVREFRRRLTGT